MIYKIKIQVTVTDEDGHKITDLVEEKYMTSEMLEAIKEKLGNDKE